MPNRLRLSRVMDVHVQFDHLVQIKKRLAPPVTAMRMVSQTKSRMWWFFKKSGYLAKTVLFSGSSMSGSIPARPSFAGLVEESEHIFSESI